MTRTVTQHSRPVFRPARSFMAVAIGDEELEAIVPYADTPTQKRSVMSENKHTPGECVPHIHKDGARVHVLSWGGYYDSKGELHGERYCSEPRCEINRAKSAGRKALANGDADHD